MNMKTRMKNMMAVLMAAGLMVACGPFDSWEDNPTDEVIDLTSLQITCEGIDGDAIALTIGGTLQLTVIVTPADATDQAIEFMSSDDAVATVTAEGLVTAIGPGTATITVASTADPTINYSITLAVADMVMNVGDAIDQLEAESRKRK
jgi:hypothetical protein